SFACSLKCMVLWLYSSIPVRPKALAVERTKRDGSWPSLVSLPNVEAAVAVLVAHEFPVEQVNLADSAVSDAHLSVDQPVAVRKLHRSFKALDPEGERLRLAPEEPSDKALHGCLSCGRFLLRP